MVPAIIIYGVMENSENSDQEGDDKFLWKGEEWK